MSRRTITVVVAIAGLLLGLVPTADAIHWYRGDADGCSPEDGELTDEGQTTPDDFAAEVILDHTTFRDESDGTSTTRIEAGEAVKWDWASSHCHSVTFGPPSQSREDRPFGTDLHYPEDAPEGPEAIPGVFHYPLLDETPTLSYSRTFDAPGEYSYYCIHHASIGMVGTVVVE